MHKYILPTLLLVALAWSIIAIYCWTRFIALQPELYSMTLRDRGAAYGMYAVGFAIATLLVGLYYFLRWRRSASKYYIIGSAIIIVVLYVVFSYTPAI